MKITPLDIENHKFKKAWKGYSMYEVDQFMKSIAEEFQAHIAENSRLKDEIFDLKSALDDFRSREKNLQDMIYSTQKFHEDMKNKTKHEEELIIKEAKLKAEKLLEQAQIQVERIERETTQLRLERDSFERKLRELIEDHLNRLEANTEEADWKDRLKFIRRPGEGEEG
jgi:cell division initiation protein